MIAIFQFINDRFEEEAVLNSDKINFGLRVAVENA